jgi:Fe-S oxidoreductase
VNPRKVALRAAVPGSQNPLLWVNQGGRRGREVRRGRAYGLRGENQREPRASRELALRVALFITCFNDTLFPETGRATVEVLERVGVEVEFPAEQTCCGQMHFNTGYQREAIPLVRRFVEGVHGPRPLEVLIAG